MVVVGQEGFWSAMKGRPMTMHGAVLSGFSTLKFVPKRQARGTKRIADTYTDP